MLVFGFVWESRRNLSVVRKPLVQDLDRGTPLHPDRTAS